MNNNGETSTRRVILNMLKTKGPLSVGEISKQLEITEMAIRRHLNTLERDKLVRTQLVRQAMGRPLNRYLLSDLAEDLFPKNYHQLTLELLDEVEQEEGTVKVGQLFERRKKKLLQKYKPRMKDKSFTDRVAELASIQDANGYMVEWEQDQEQNFILKEYNCPISKIANQYQDACQCELSMFKTLLETDEVERTECLAKGGGKCEYKIRSG